ncbi:hypothetical protein GCM10011502_18720 [Oceanisphaera marina]|uniref:DUF1634 domain-containing protein n=1 Tax=Oceanisphaera marina TaxID=2017550 RepID=A0ABQ1IKQ0_9GAMM|nr:hypothetical protein [Oceanisphaera marina]GGB45661.1 hypothetical protein GCM10011502_18720 [Oceanisphaera marina]
MAPQRLDWLSKMLVTMTVGGWGLYIILLVLFHYGRPEQDFGYLRYQDIAVRTEWLALHSFWFHAGVWGALGLAVTTFTLVHVKGRHHLQFLKIYLVMLAMAAVLTLLLVVFSSR